MKKCLKITGFILLYVIILAVFVMSVAIFWWNNIKTGFLGKNFNFSSLLGFVLVLAAYGLIFKLRKQNLIKICSFSRLSAGQIVSLAITGTAMGLFTSFFCNTSLVVDKLQALRSYVTTVEEGNSSFIVFLLTITLIFVCEEMIFRGTMFNELRRGMNLYLAVILSTALYGVLNGLTQGYLVGTYAYIASLLYTLAYVYTGSLFAPIILQVASMYTISFIRIWGFWDKLEDMGDTIMAIGSVLSVAILAIFYYFMYTNYKKSGAGKKNIHLSA